MQNIYLILLLAGQPGQGAPFNPFPRDNTRQLRAAREMCVARVGQVCRKLVEERGECAVAALRNCTLAMGRKLSEFHNSGALGKVYRPELLLSTIGRKGHGDDVALFAMEHGEQLADPDAFAAYCGDPLVYALGIRELAEGAAEVRAARLNPHGNAQPSYPPLTEREMWLGGGVLGVMILLMFFVRTRRPAGAV